ncbi:MAG: DegV family protein [Clostridia bacterium]|nr:DegV family protein [Clostridia bacterium]
MRKILFSTDQICDVPEGYTQKHNVMVLPLAYTINDIEYDDIKTKQLPTLTLFDLMRKGGVPKTSQTNPEVAKSFFVKKINEGYDIFHLSTSSGISGTHGSVLLAVEEIEAEKEKLITKENQDYKIIELDSFTGAGGEGMLLDMLIKFSKEGDKTIEELEVEAKRLIPMCCHFFTLDDLGYLARGGRISKKKAVVGSLLQVKPMLHMNMEGKLIQIGQTMGRKKSIKTLVDYIEKKIIKGINKIIYISQGDCLNDVEFLKEEIIKRLGITEFMVSLCSTIVGAHTGPGAIGVFFLGKDRLAD